MAINPSGIIGIGGTPPAYTASNSIELQLGNPGTAQASLNDTAVRNLSGPGPTTTPGTTISMSNFYGKSNRVALSFTIASNTQNYNVYTVASASPSYVAGKTDVTVTVNPAIVVGSSSIPSYAMLVPSSFSPTDTVTIVNNGYIVGGGGPGGNGGPSNAAAGTPGAAGGNALYVNRPTTVTNNGTVGAGGGGGGGGGAGGRPGTSPAPGSGGGGGAGYTAGSGGSGGNASSPGSTTSGGSGGATVPASKGTGGAGGPGGGLGASGSNGAAGTFTGSPPVQGAGGSGGPSANYITGNPFVTWPVTGTRLGGVA